MPQPHKQQNSNYSIFECIIIALTYVVTLYLVSLTILPKNIPFLENNVSSESTAVLD